MIILNLGCSDDLMPDALNVDRGPDPRPAGDYPVKYAQADLNHSWPWETSSVDKIIAYDVFEHLQPSDGTPGKIWAFNESWRVLKPGGILDMKVPCAYLGQAGQPGAMNPGAFADPTHVTFWTWEDQFYFSHQMNRDREGERFRLGPAYGIEAVFLFPSLHRWPSGQGWRQDRTDMSLRWDLIEYGGNLERRSKLHGILKAVK